MKWPVIILPLLAGCTPYQASQNADQLISNISNIREAQVIYNIGRAIDDPTMVPGAVVITQGTAQTTTNLGVTLSWAAHFVKSLSSPLTNSWTSSWQLTPVTDGGDLQNLRSIYEFIVTAHTTEETKTTGILRLFNTATPQGISLLSVSPPPTRNQAIDILIHGQSAACQEYQQNKSTNNLYNPWLFWYDGRLKPEYSEYPPDTLTQIGNHGGVPIYITSRPCFDDFIVLVQSSSPATHAAAAIGAKSSAIVPAPAE
jgi:hypothetical protein